MAVVQAHTGDAQADPARTMRAGSSSFAGAARLLDPATRAAVQRLYAWCRHCDDVVDGQVLGHAAASPATPAELQARVAELRAQTQDALAGRPCRNPAFAGLRDVAARHALDPAHALALIDGFAMDAAGRHYACLQDTIDYAWHVAGVVGVMMATIMGVADAATRGRAADLGTAFQLSNIARDVMDDAAIGRVYLPADWLAEEGISPAVVRLPGNRAAVARVVARLVAEAEPFYDSARLGIAALPWRAALAIAAARAVYRDIGLQVRDRGPRAWDSRTTLTRPRRLSLTAGAVLGAAASRLR